VGWATSFWLVDALHASGQRRDAIDLFERLLLLLRNDVGLLSEEWDPVAQREHRPVRAALVSGPEGHRFLVEERAAAVTGAAPGPAQAQDQA
jgi:hypothetical protein